MWRTGTGDLPNQYELAFFDYYRIITVKYKLKMKGD